MSKYLFFVDTEMLDKSCERDIRLTEVKHMNLILSSSGSIPGPTVGVRAGTWSWVNTRQIVCCYVVSTAPYLGTCGLVDDLSQHQFGPNFWNSSLLMLLK